MQVTEKVTVRSIVLERIEGPTRECGTCTPAYSYEEADRLLYIMSHSAPEDGCYDKTDFTIEFEDSYTYTGRYDLKHFTVERPNLKRHVAAHVLCYAGLMEMPLHMLDGPGSPNVREREAKENWKNFLDWLEGEGIGPKTRNFARRYDVGVEVSGEEE